jgi:hypothetical protein
MIKKTKLTKKGDLKRLEDREDDKRVASKENLYGASANFIIKRITPLDDESMPSLTDAEEQRR